MPNTTKLRNRAFFAGISKSVSIAASTMCGYLVHSHQEGDPVWHIVLLVVSAIVVIFYSEYKRETS